MYDICILLQNIYLHIRVCLYSHTISPITCMHTHIYILHIHTYICVYVCTCILLYRTHIWIHTHECMHAHTQRHLLPSFHWLSCHHSFPPARGSSPMLDTAAALWEKNEEDSDHGLQWESSEWGLDQVESMPDARLSCNNRDGTCWAGTLPRAVALKPSFLSRAEYRACLWNTPSAPHFPGAQRTSGATTQCLLGKWKGEYPWGVSFWIANFFYPIILGT